MRENPINIIRYWRNSLADEGKIGLNVSEVRNRGIRFESSYFKQGRLDAYKIKPLFDEAENNLRKEIHKKNKYKIEKNRNDAFVEIKEIEVLLAPFVAGPIMEHGVSRSNGNRPKEVYPLWLNARVNKTGELFINGEQQLPWIDRRCLTPNESVTGFPIIGEVETVDRFYTEKENVLNKNNVDWQAFYQYGYELLMHTIHHYKGGTFNSQGYERLKEGYIIPAKSHSGSTSSIIRTLDQYLNSNEQALPELLSQFISLKDAKAKKERKKEELFLSSKHHLGQMSATAPLTASQRIALGHLFFSKTPDIFTVNGPPGTGKTTFLQSVIASLWIRSAIQDKKPPIIVASSTNNQAITNILDSFKTIEKSEKLPISQRFLPEFESYGLFLPGKSKEESARQNNYPYCTKGRGLGNLSSYLKESYIAKATDYFLQKMKTCFDKPFKTLNTARLFLHTELIKLDQALKNMIDTANRFFDLKKRYEASFGGIIALKDLLVDNKRRRKSLDKEIQYALGITNAWVDYKDEKFFWIRIFSFIPLIKKIQIERVKRFCFNHSYSCPHEHPTVEIFTNLLDQKMVSLQKEKVAVIQETKIIEDRIDTFFHHKKRFESLLRDQKIKADIATIYAYEDPKSLLPLLDTTLRYSMFLLATHYWEARWLENALSQKECKYNFEGCKRYWEIFSMLTPCFITTFHTGPSYFQYLSPSRDWETLSDFIDLLIIDEAGQVAPHLSSAMISIARKVLIVGDTHQIEPVMTLMEGMDLANSKKYGLCEDEKEFDAIKKLGILCSGNPRTLKSYGNTMVVAQRKAPYQLLKHTVRGMVLEEHWRCDPKIISFCNELCYENKLIPMKKEKAYILPRMGYAHIKGKEEKVGASRRNPLEALGIIKWIKDNQAKILHFYKGTHNSLDECIGIISPFKGQAEQLMMLSHQYGLTIKKIGTVHALQGSEKPIIIFSPVYTRENFAPSFFFDRSVNMLNVAVSRAVDSFLVFGDMDIFNNNMGKEPSTLLSKYLFQSEASEIPNIKPPKYALMDDVEHITTLEKHQSVLRESFEWAEKELTIVSPFLRTRAIEKDDICNLIAQFRSGIDITIYSDPYLNKGAYESNYNAARKMLEKAGAAVINVKNVHSKIIAVDQKIIVEGSFNWLSASRVSNQYQREETSILYSGLKVAQFIRESLEPIKARKI